MKIAKRCLAALLALGALAAAGFGIYTALHWWRQPPVLEQVSPAAQQQVDSFFSALESGDYALAESLILGAPSLGMDGPVEGELAGLVWKAYQDNLEFEPVGDFYATNNGIAIDYRVTKLDFDSVLETVAERAEAHMEQTIAQAKNMEEIYDSNNAFRPELIQESMLVAVESALQEDASYTQKEFTVQLIYQDGAWWIFGNKLLISAISPDFAR